MYEQHPVPEKWSGFPVEFSAGVVELWNAWDIRPNLERAIAKAEHATMLPQETITIGGKNDSCYVVHATRDWDREDHDDLTYWIDKKKRWFFGKKSGARIPI